MNKKAIIKARKIIDEVMDKGNLKKYNMTPDDFREFSYCVYELLKGKQVFTFRNNVKKMVEKCGFVVTEDGVGWIVE